MQRYSGVQSPQSKSTANLQKEGEQNELAFKWATHILFNVSTGLRNYYTNRLIKQNVTCFNKCLIYVKDKKEADSIKTQIQSKTKIIAILSGSNQVQNTINSNKQTKVFVTFFQPNDFDTFTVPASVNLIINAATPAQEKNYQKIVIKDPKSVKYTGVVINFCFKDDFLTKKMQQFIKLRGVATQTFQSLEKKQFNLQNYYKTVQIQKKIQQKKAENKESTNMKAEEVNVAWPTYIIVNTEQQYRIGRTANYLEKNSNKFDTCIVYVRLEARATTIAERLQPIFNNLTVVIKDAQSFADGLQKLSTRQLRILVVALSQFSIENLPVNFLLPDSVDLIIIDGIQNSLLAYRKKLAKSNLNSKKSGVVINMLTTSEEIQTVKKFCNSYNIAINETHRKEDYELGMYFKKEEPKYYRSQVIGQNSKLPQQKIYTNKASSQIQPVYHPKYEQSSGVSKNQQDLQSNPRDKEQVAQEPHPGRISGTQKEQVAMTQSCIQKQNQLKVETRELGQQVDENQNKLSTLIKKENIGVKSVHSSEEQANEANGNNVVKSVDQVNQIQVKVQTSQNEPKINNKPVDAIQNTNKQEQPKPLENQASSKENALQSNQDDQPKQFKISQTDNPQSTKKQEFSEHNSSKISSSEDEEEEKPNSLNGPKSEMISSVIVANPSRIQGITQQKNPERIISREVEKIQEKKDDKEIVSNQQQSKNIEDILKISNIIHNDVISIPNVITTTITDLIANIAAISGNVKQIIPAQANQAQSIISKIQETGGQVRKSINLLGSQQSQTLTQSFNSVVAQHQQIQHKLEQLPQKLKQLHNSLSQKQIETRNSIEDKSRANFEAMSLNTNQSKEEILRELREGTASRKKMLQQQNAKIIGLLQTQNRDVSSKNEEMKKQLDNKKIAAQTYQNKRIRQLQQLLSNKEIIAQTDEKMKKTITQLQDKYKQCIRQIQQLREDKIKAASTNKELDRLKLELKKQQKDKEKAIQDLNIFKAKYKDAYDILVSNYALKENQCQELKGQVGRKNQRISQLAKAEAQLIESRDVVLSMIRGDKKQNESQMQKMISKSANTMTAMMNQNAITATIKNMTKLKEIESVNLPKLIKSCLVAEIKMGDLKSSSESFLKAIPPKLAEKVLTDSKEAREFLFNLRNLSEVVNKQGSYSYLITTILKLAEEYDSLKKNQLDAVKYCRQLEATFKSLCNNVEQSVQKGIESSTAGLLDLSFKSSPINTYLPRIHEAFNKTIKSLSIKTSQLQRANKQIQQLKKINNNQSSIITGLNAEKKKLGEDLKQAKLKIANYQTQLQQAKSTITTLTSQLTQAQKDLKASKLKIQQLQGQLDALRGNYATLQAKLKQTEKQLQDALTKLQECEKDLRICRQQLVKKDNKITELENTLEGQKIKAKNQREESARKYRQLEVSSQRKMEQKCQQLENKRQKDLKSLQDKYKKQIDMINKKNDDQKQQRVSLANKFIKDISQSIKNSIGYDISLSIDNYYDQLSQFQKATNEKMTKLKFLSESETYRNMSEDQQRFVYASVKRIVPNKKICSTKTLFQGYAKGNFDQWLTKILDRPNLLVLITLKNNHLIGAFSENPFSKTKSARGKGYMMSITNKRIYDIKPKFEGKVAKYDDFMFSLGNNELLIKSNCTYSAIFAKQFCYFETGNDSISDFLGQEQDEGEYNSIEFHQVLFQQNK